MIRDISIFAVFLVFVLSACCVGKTLFQVYKMKKEHYQDADKE